jgi:hypothetical protein
MQCPLCDSTQIAKYGKTTDGLRSYQCDSCKNIFTDSKEKAFYSLKINFLKLKERASIQAKVFESKQQVQSSESKLFLTVESVTPKPITFIMQAKRSVFPILLFVGFGFALTFIVPNIALYFHKTDVQTFHAWADCFNQTGREIYLACYYDNSPTPGLIAAYPSIGMLASGGIIAAIKSMTASTDWELISNIFRSYLFLFDLFNLFLFITIARMMQFRKPMQIGLGLFLIPSNLAGGALWGQIDNIALTFCLVTSIALIKSWSIDRKDYAGSQHRAIAWLLVAVTSLPIFILVKQLSIFSFPYFVVIFTITAIKFWQNWQRKGMLWIAGALGIFATAFYCFDHILTISDKFFGSSYYYIWTGGDIDSRYIISANGFNIWMFLGRDPASSSRVPFSLLWNNDLAISMSPHDLGVLLYLAWSLFLLGTTGILAHKLLAESRITPNRIHPKLVAVLFLYHGLSHLGFNLLLTGTHERYLYTGYPFLLLAGAWFFTQRMGFSWRLIGLCFLSAFIYGCFVFSIIGPLPGIFFPFSRHEFLASLHLFLLVLLGDAWVQICRANHKLDASVGQSIPV